MQLEKGTDRRSDSVSRDSDTTSTVTNDHTQRHEGNTNVHQHPMNSSDQSPV